MADPSKTGPLEIRPKVEHSKTGHVRFSDPHCIVQFANLASKIIDGSSYFVNDEVIKPVVFQSPAAAAAFLALADFAK